MRALTLVLILLLGVTTGCATQWSAGDQASLDSLVRILREGIEIAYLRAAYLSYDKDPETTDDLLATMILLGLPGTDKDGAMKRLEDLIKSQKAIRFLAFMKMHAEQLKAGNISRAALRYKILEENERIGQEREEYFARQRQESAVERQDKAIERPTRAIEALRRRGDPGLDFLRGFELGRDHPSGPP